LVGVFEALPSDDGDAVPLSWAVALNDRQMSAAISVAVAAIRSLIIDALDIDRAAIDVHEDSDAVVAM